MAIPVELLKTFVVFAESENIFIAAEKLGLSQPAVSVHLKNFESHLGRPLFSLKGKKKVLNPFGKALFTQTANKLHDLESDLVQMARQYQELKDVTIHIAGRREIISYLSNQINFLGAVHFHSMDKETAIQALLQHKVDFAVVQTEPNLPNLYSRKLFSNGVSLLVHKKLLKKESDLTDSAFYFTTPLISYKDPDPFIWPYLKSLKIERHPNAKFIIDDWSAIVQMIENEMGYALVPDMFEPKNKDVLRFPISDRIIPKTHFFVLFREDTKKLFPLVKVFK